MKIHRERSVRTIAAIAMVVILCLSFGSALAARPPVKAYGTLTSIEADNTVVIDGQGYGLSPYVRIIEGKGKKVSSFEEFTLPSRVYFEYENTERGPIIKLIKEIAK